MDVKENVMNQEEIDSLEVSPASVIPKSLITWNTENLPTETTVDSDKVTFMDEGRFKFARSNEIFETGRHNFKILIDKMDRSGLEYASIGISWNVNESMNSGVYYFSKSHLYCNFYPTITNGINQLISSVPKFKQGDLIGIGVDLDNGTLEYFVNDEQIYSTTLGNEKNPIWMTCGMFDGTLAIVSC